MFLMTYTRIFNKLWRFVFVFSFCFRFLSSNFRYLFGKVACPHFETILQKLCFRKFVLVQIKENGSWDATGWCQWVGRQLRRAGWWLFQYNWFVKFSILRWNSFLKFLLTSNFRSNIWCRWQLGWSRRCIRIKSSASSSDQKGKRGSARRVVEAGIAGIFSTRGIR